MNLLDAIKSPTYQHKEYGAMQAAQGPARIFLTLADMTLAESCMDAYEVPDKAKTLEGFKDGYLMSNLWVQQVRFTLAERSALAPHIGDTFYHFFAGKTPVVADITAVLLNPAGDAHKQALVLAYKNMLRLSAVARMGIRPGLTFTGYTMPGAITKLSLQETSQVDGALTVTFSWLLFSLEACALENTSDLAVTSASIKL